MTNILNYMPHTLNIELPSGERIAIESSGEARCAVKNVQIGDVNGIPVVSAEYGEVVGLPEPQPNTIYVVSMLVAHRANRPDCFGPDSGPTAVRENGQVVAVRNLVRY